MEKIIVSMTTWPPRFAVAYEAMAVIVEQVKYGNLQDRVHCVMVLSEEEACATETRRAACHLMCEMYKLGVEVIIDRGNIKSHKKLIPTLEKYPNNPILVVDDDNVQWPGWLKTFVSDHDKHPDDIIYGQSLSHIELQGDRIVEVREQGIPFENAGKVTVNMKPANGSAGTLYPAHTFTDPRFFDRELFMRLSPTSDETWQWAFAKIVGKTFRQMSGNNMPMLLGAPPDSALWHINKDKYTDIHNAIAAEIPEYLQALKKEAAQ